MDSRIREVLNEEGENYIFPFLWMHGEEESVIRKYMRVIHEAGIGAVCVESRPHPDFLGEGWWRDMDIILEEAKKYGMKVWILDDSHFPTGYANGALKDKSPELCRQYLACRVVTELDGGKESRISKEEFSDPPKWEPNMIETYQLPEAEMRKFDDDHIIAISAVKKDGRSRKDRIDLNGSLKEGELRFRLPEGRWKIYVCYLTRNRGPHRDYINMLSKESCRILLDTVYEAHYAHYKEEFGNTIAGFFSDEPELGNGHLYETGKRIFELDDQPWSQELEQELRNLWKEDFDKNLPLLWEEEFSDAETAKIRYEYMDLVTRTVRQDFSMQIGNWCRAHGVEYIGHLIEDNHQHTRTGSSLGHYFRGLAGQDMAGIDDIGGQVFPQGEWDGPHGLMGEFRCGRFYHYVLGKLGASLAAVDPLKKGNSMCEIFGNYGWEEGVKLEKYLIDHFLVRGINHYVPHAFSPKAFPDPDCPPHFYAHGHHPQYRHFGELMRYTNRVCHLIAGGRKVTRTAILYQAESEWTGEYMKLEDPAQILYDHQIDFDFIPADVFADREKYHTKIDGNLSVNGNIYQTLIIPKSQFIPQDTIQAAFELDAAGGNVFFLEQRPQGTCEGGKISAAGQKAGEVIKTEALADILTERKLTEIRLKPECARIRCLHYQGESSRYLFVNEDVEHYRGDIYVPDTGECYAYNAWENQLETVSCQRDIGGTILRADIEPGKSWIVVFDRCERTLHDPIRMQENEVMWNRGWKRSICKSIEYPIFGEKKIVDLPDQLEKEFPIFSGFVRYENTLQIKRIPEKFVLEITDASEGVEVFVNGESLGIQITAPYRYEAASYLKSGQNQFVVEVATTLEREMSAEWDPVREYLGMEQKIPECCSGISGQIKYCVVEKEEK